MYRFARAVLRPVMTPWADISVIGEENVPSAGPCILVFNHLSDVDPLFLDWFFMLRNTPVRFLAKKSLFEVPVLGGIITGMGLIPVDREGDAAASLDAAKKALAAGDIVIIMPEGTLTRDPRRWPMTLKTGAARLALDTGAPIIPAAQWGPEEIIAPYESGIDLRPKRKVAYNFRPAIDFSDLMSPEGSQNRAAVAELTSRMFGEITAALEVLRGEKAPVDVWQPRTQDGPWWEYEQRKQARRQKKQARLERRSQRRQRRQRKDHRGPHSKNRRKEASRSL